MAIERLNQGTPSQASQLPFFDNQNGQDRRMSVTQLAALIQSLLTSGGGMVTQYAAVSGGFSVTVSPPTDGASVFFIITPLGGYVAGSGTITLPASAVDGQEVLVSCGAAVTTLTVSGGANSVAGAPASLAANNFFRLRFDGVLSTWFRIG